MRKVGSCSGTLGLTGRLAGLPVLEITTSWASPICGCLLGDLGADVVKVEPTSACRPTRAGESQLLPYRSLCAALKVWDANLKMARFQPTEMARLTGRAVLVALSGTGSARPEPPYLGAWGRRARRECHR